MEGPGKEKQVFRREERNLATGSIRAESKEILEQKGAGLEKRNDRRHDQCEVAGKAGEELGSLGSRNESGLSRG